MPYPWQRPIPSSPGQGTSSRPVRPVTGMAPQLHLTPTGCSDIFSIEGSAQNLFFAFCPVTPMADIIALQKKIQQSRRKKKALLHRRKLEAVRQVLQCSHCSMKCEKCGTHLQSDDPQKPFVYQDLQVPYRFCESCALEYRDYIECLKDNGEADCYWHNQAWIDSWRAWIDYQGAVSRYLHSKEFNQLLEELRQDTTDL